MVSWYQGEGNGASSYDISQYSCFFAKMIENWRQIWNECTNSITAIQFPFGFVQVFFSQKLIQLS